MKIREGAYYRTRDGFVVGPMRRVDWCDATFTAGDFTWNEDGSYVQGIPYKMDLISEVYVSDTPPPVGSIWRSATGRVYVVVNNRMASGQAGWYVWVQNRSTPFRQKEWEAARMLHTGMV